MTVEDLQAGQLLGGRFELVERLGRGGIGEVWRIADTRNPDDAVACKILRPDLRDDRAAIAFLKREVLVSRRLRHPAIVRVFTMWEDESLPFVTMEYIEGENLAQRIQQEPMGDIDQISKVLHAIAAALDYAHGHGVVHRDIKPENILLDGDGRVCLTDFGLAEAAFLQDSDRGDRNIRGTLVYLSPEILEGSPPSAASDQYSLAVTAYEMISGRPPFAHGNLYSQIQVKMPPPIVEIPDAANKVLFRALSKGADRRYPSCMDFSAALVDALGGRIIGTVLTPAGAAADENRDTAVLGRFDVKTRRTRLGRLLLELKIIGQEQLADALLRQDRDDLKLGEALLALGHITEDALVDVLATQLQIARAPSPFAADPKLAELAGAESLAAYHAAPIHRSAYGVVVAMADPLDMAALNHLEEIYDEMIDPVVATYSQIDEALAALS